MQNFRKYIEKNTTVSGKELLFLESIASSRYLKKGGVLLQEGERCDKEIFVESGVVRSFLVDEEGNEKNTAFFQAGEFIGIASQRTKQQLSLYCYQAVFQATVLLFDSKVLVENLSRIKQLHVVGAKIKTTERERISKREHCLVQVKAKDKYLKFLECYPELEHRIPQAFIASYLGITPVSLSRLKKNLLRDDSLNN